MTQHVDEIEYHHIQVVLVQLVQLLHKLLSIGRRVNLVIRERLMSAITFQLCLDQRSFVQVLALLLIFINP